MIKDLLKSSVFKNILTLVSGSILAQVVNFVFNIFLTRLYTPEQFGLLSVFISVMSFITVFSAGKFDVAIVAAKEDTDAKKLFSLSFFVLLIVSVCTLLVAFIIDFFNLYQQSAISEWFYYLAPSVVFVSGFQICWMWNVRIKNFKKISFVRVAEPLTNGITSILFVGLAASGLLFATLLGQLISFALMLILIFYKYPFNGFIFSFKELKDTFNKFSIYPKVNIAQGFLEVFQMSSFVLLLDAFFNAAVTGFFALGMRVLQIPVRLLVLPISHVFFAEASEAHREGQSLYPLVKKTIVRTVFVALPLPIILMFMGPYLFGLVFGENWTVAGEYAKILAIWTFFDLIKAPIIQIAPILNKQKKILYYSILSSIVFVFAFLIGGWFFHNIETTLWLVTITQSIMTFILILFILKMSKLAT